jgi:predicted aldo/keto reductase-like oxidoreductase
MKYRKFGMLNWEVSSLGFGAMRLPTIGGDRAKIDEAEAIKMIRYTIDHGVNYVDTGYRYHEGKSEGLLGKALKDGYREKIRLATKMPVRLLNSSEDLERIFGEQLTRLQTDHIDFYLLHGIRRAGWSKVKELNVLKWAEKELAERRIRHLGFSFHDEFEVFKEVVDGYDGWTFCQIQYNYVDNESSSRTPGTRGLKYAASKGLGVVVMEPIQGGNLAVKPPTEIQTLWDEAKIRTSPAELALQWVWNQPEVSVVLSGMSTMNQVIENIASADRSGIGTLTERELDFTAKIRERYLNYGFIGCTGCRYCTPCPNQVAIPEIMTLYNQYFMKKNDRKAQQEIAGKYDETIPAENRAERCVKCGECEAKCPQQLPIRNLLAGASRSFARTGR